ncbi:MAG: sensor domain-containing diguanylate cyclase [Candidatus Omnitrophica bacterium]|nr:sensor domain-containing diguanylate cyclase [Candidatus Omnitrophota bacterium]
MEQNIDKGRLQKHLKILQEAVRVFFQVESELNQILKTSLKHVMDDIDFDAVYIFLYEETSNSLECFEARMREKGIIGGESRIPVKEDGGGQLVDVFLGKCPSVIWDDGLQICLPLRTADDKLGLLIADKLTSRQKITQEEGDMLSDYAREFSWGIRHMKIFRVNTQKIEMLLALSKISEAMTSALELNGVLSIILKSAIEVLYFDRAKLYLIDKEKKMLKGVAIADIRKAVRPIEMEQYHIEKGVNRIVDSLFEEEAAPAAEAHGTEAMFLYVPLIVQNARIGVLVVDNVFSQQPITKDDRESIDILANQAAITIEKARLYEEVKELSIRDSLTGLYVHNFLLTRLEEEVKRAARMKEKFSLMIIDIDGFKRYNDLYGHQAGDEVILSLARILNQNIRSFDVKGRALDSIGRYGGDEFVLLLAGADANIGLSVAKRLREAVKAREVKIDGKSIYFTISMGIAVYPDDGTTQQQLFKKADEALYWVKQHGKDQICLAKDAGKKDSKEIL